MLNKFRVLAINPCSTSTKVGVYEGDQMIYEGVIRHTPEEIAGCDGILAQAPMRMKLIKKLLADEKVDLSSIDAFVGRGGIVKPMLSGVYTVSDKLLNDLKTMPSSLRHASALGGIFARELGEEYGKPAYIVDPVVVDERTEIAKMTGLPGIKRGCVFHCLNQKAVARLYSAKIGKKYNECNFVVAHMGGGITVGAHEKGVIVDVTDGMAGEGPFSPERVGSLPVKTVLDMVYSGKYTKEELYSFTAKSGGFVAHCHTNSMIDVEKAAAAGDENAKAVFDAMAYNVGKSIGEMAAVLKGRVDAILLTGGLAYSEHFCEEITEMVEFIAPVVRYPGESELSALAAGAMRVLSGEESAREY